jgi:hypothetical protein
MPRAKAAKADAGDTPGPVSPFGKPSFTSEPAVVSGGKGIPMEVAFAPKVLPGESQVHPEDRKNPDYLQKSKAESEVRKKSVMQTFGYGVTPVVVGASPNSIPRVAKFIV